MFTKGRGGFAFSRYNPTGRGYGFQGMFTKGRWIRRFQGIIQKVGDCLPWGNTTVSKQARPAMPV